MALSFSLDGYIIDSEGHIDDCGKNASDSEENQEELNIFLLKFREFLRGQFSNRFSTILK